jgi:hypothetical protein
VNTVGLERRGFDRERLETIERAFRLLLRSKLNTTQAIEQIRAQLNGSPDIRELVEFIESASAACTSEFLNPTPPLVPSRRRPFGWGLIAGNGNFRFWCWKRRADQGIEMAVIAIREEASPELEKVAARLHWVSLGELSRTLELLHQEGVTRAVMAGQVKHNKIFSSIRPDWKLAKLLLSLPLKNTDSLIGAVARVLESEGINWWTRPRF